MSIGQKPYLVSGSELAKIRAAYRAHAKSTIVTGLNVLYLHFPWLRAYWSGVQAIAFALVEIDPEQLSLDIFLQ